jgi:hypothetical protein
MVSRESIHEANKCAFTLSFLRKSQPVSNEDLSFYNSHKPVVKIHITPPLAVS